MSQSVVREKILVLCRAVPEEGRKYFQTVCVAGLTDGGEFRRLYPIVFKPFTKDAGIPFHKKEWVEVLTSPPDDRRDTRKESRKVDETAVRVVGKIEDDELRVIIQSHLSPSIKVIASSGASLGLIKPRLVGFECEPENTDEFNSDKIDIYGRPIAKVKLSQTSRYKFYCQERSGCCIDRPHSMEIRDWEVNELYRNIIRTDKNIHSIREKMRKKLFDWMFTRDIYLMVGTHHRWKTWMVISILYPKKPD